MLKKLFTKIKNHIEYKKKVKLLKVLAVNTLANTIVNKNAYIIGFQKMLLTMATTNDATELQNLLNDYTKVVLKTNVVSDGKTEIE